MSDSETNGRSPVKKAQSVTGLVNSGDLGVTLPHEHLLIDLTIWFVEPENEISRKQSREPITLQNLGWISHNQYNHLDNVRLQDEAVAVEEVLLFKQHGGSTIVDVTTRGLSPNPSALKRIAVATGLNIIAGSGYYVLREKDADALCEKSDEAIAEGIIADILEGFGNDGVRAGIIGEIGCSWPLEDSEKKALRAAAIAQQRTGAAITIHPGRHEDSPMEIITTLDKAGADISRVIIGHIDRTGFPPDKVREILKTGSYIEYDLFGSNAFYPLHFGVFPRPCDRERIEQIRKLIDENYLDQILISQDICLKTRLTRYGGTGYAHILRNILPQMLARGITEKHIHAMMVENPRRFLCFI